LSSARKIEARRSAPEAPVFALRFFATAPDYHACVVFPSAPSCASRAASSRLGDLRVVWIRDGFDGHA
jgi:hypothetical protein